MATLFQRATGYTHVQKHKKILANGKIQIVETSTYYPPEVGAQMIWLKNRRPDEWRDKREIVTDGKVQVEVTGGLPKDTHEAPKKAESE